MSKVDPKNKHFGSIRITDIPGYIHIRKANDMADLDPDKPLNQIKPFEERFPYQPERLQKHPAFAVNLQGQAPELAGSETASDWGFHRRKLAEARAKETDKRKEVRIEDAIMLHRDHNLNVIQAEIVRKHFYFKRNQHNQVKLSRDIQQANSKQIAIFQQNVLRGLQQLDDQKFQAFLMFWIKEQSPSATRIQRLTNDALLEDTLTEARIKDSATPNELQRLLLAVAKLLPLMIKYQLYDMFLAIFTQTMQTTATVEGFALARKNITTIFGQLFAKMQADLAQEGYERTERHFEDLNSTHDLDEHWAAIASERDFQNTKHFASLDQRKGMYEAWYADRELEKLLIHRADWDRERGERAYEAKQDVLPVTYGSFTAYVKQDPASQKTQLGLIKYWNDAYRKKVENTEIFAQLKQEQNEFRAELEAKVVEKLGSGISAVAEAEAIAHAIIADSVLQKKFEHIETLQGLLFYESIDQISKMFAAQPLAVTQGQGPSAPAAHEESSPAAGAKSVAPAPAGAGGKKVA